MQNHKCLFYHTKSKRKRQEQKSNLYLIVSLYFSMPWEKIVIQQNQYILIKYLMQFLFLLMSNRPAALAVLLVGLLA